MEPAARRRLFFTGMSYDNTVALGASTWRHVEFIERPVPLGGQSSNFSWLMLSDVCKHCERAGCLEACPTGAIIRTEFDTVYVQPDICNGCGYCVVSCPFGVIDRQQDDGRAWKCTLCYDRLKDDMEPACAKACPTDSILFGELEELREKARGARGAVARARRAGSVPLRRDAENQPGTEGLNAFFLLVDKPEVYNLPPDPVAPAKKVGASWASLAIASLGILAAAAGAVISARKELR